MKALGRTSGGAHPNNSVHLWTESSVRSRPVNYTRRAVAFVCISEIVDREAEIPVEKPGERERERELERPSF